MDVLAGVIGGLMAGLVGAYVALRMLKPNIAVAKSQESANLSKALKDAVDAMLATSADRNKLEERLDELEAHRDQRSEELAKLRSQNEDLQAGMIGLNNRLEQMSDELSRKDRQMNAVRGYMAELLLFFESRNISDYPEPPDDLLDTSTRMKLGKLRGKK